MSGVGDQQSKDAYDQARKDAIEREKGWFTSKEEAFSETGGNREAFIHRQARKYFYAGRQDPSDAPATPLPAQPPASAAAPNGTPASTGAAPSNGPPTERWVKDSRGKWVPESDLRGVP